jgi:serine/threonine protein kinase
MDSFLVGGWEIHPELNRIVQGNEQKHLEPRVMDLLVYLATHQGEVLTKDRIVQAVWKDVFVGDESVTTVINKLRRLFQDDAKEPQYIETIARRGYRLIAKVTMPEDDSQDQTNRYRILQKLGDSEFSKVFLAQDPQLNRNLALKLLQSDKEDDENWLKRLRREARAAAALDHPFVCKIYETGKLNGQSFIAMEYVEGEKLSDRIKAGSLALNDCLKIVREIAEALEAAHRQGIVHRDIKPANIILTARDHVKVTGFGIAKKFKYREGEGDWTLTRTGEKIPASAEYLSPEQIKGDPADQRTDLFLLGILFYEMLTGRHPFRREEQSETTAWILSRDPLPLGNGFPSGLQESLSKLLKKRPAHRYQRVQDFLDDLEAIGMNLNKGQTIKTVLRYFARKSPNPKS